LEAGKSQLIVVQFTPADTLIYAVVTDTAFINVDRAVLTVTAENIEVKSGETIPELPLIYSGFVNGDDISDIDKLPVASSSGKSGSVKGVYEITVSGGEDNNYSFVYISGSLTIVSAESVDNLKSLSLSVYPNPFADKVTISSEYSGEGSYQLTDLTGKVVVQGAIVTENSVLSLSHIRKGVYLLQVKLGETSKTIRLVKE